MKRDRAAYMREYRARTKTTDDVTTTGRIAELEAEVARLKRELAARPAPVLRPFNTRPFTPVPKIRGK